jgi:hypothetical protein
MSAPELREKKERKEVVGPVVFEDDDCIVISLSESLSQIDSDNCYDLGCCDNCPNYTTSPCSC